MIPAVPVRRPDDADRYHGAGCAVAAVALVALPAGVAALIAGVSPGAQADGTLRWLVVVGLVLIWPLGGLLVQPARRRGGVAGLTTVVRPPVIALGGGPVDGVAQTPFGLDSCGVCRATSAVAARVPPALGGDRNPPVRPSGLLTRVSPADGSSSTTGDPAVAARPESADVRPGGDRYPCSAVGAASPPADGAPFFSFLLVGAPAVAGLLPPHGGAAGDRNPLALVGVR